MDRITSAKITGQSFARDPDFDLDAFAVQAFGSYHSEDEYGRVVWRFAPSAAAVAREFEFHPTQQVTEEPDGSLRVEFMASGQLTEKLSINAGYIFNPVTYDEGFIGDDGVDLSGQQLLSAPKHKIVLSGEFVEPVNDRLDFFTSANIIYRSEVLTNNRDPERFVFPAGEFVNLRAGVRHPDGNWTASVFVRNLTQTREPAATLPMNFQGNDDFSVRGVPNAGLTTRVVGASVGFNF
jgi:hypothetical protein